MKKFMLMLFAVIISFSLTACAFDRDKDKDTATNEGVNNANPPVSNPPMTDNNNQTTNNNVTANQNLTIADNVSNHIATMDEVDSAVALVSNNIAYVGVQLKNGINSSDALEKKIGDEVKKVAPQYTKVYISFDPDFSKQLADYKAKVEQKEPVQNFFNDFTATVERFFPKINK